MKTKFTFILMMMIALGTTKMFAQSDYKKVRIGLGLEGALPVGATANAYNVGAGATFRVAIALDETSAFTATTGVIAFIPKSFSGVNTKAQINIPIKAGYKHMLGETLYGLGEAGMTMARTYIPSTGSGSLSSVSTSSFTYSVGVGAHLGGFDPSIRYEGYSGSGFIGLRIGFNF